MITSYYKIPLDTFKIVKNKEIDNCDLKESIVGFIHLITTSYFGECTFDESFGCSICKKRVDIIVKGVVSRTNEQFSCVERFYIAPLSF